MTQGETRRIALKHFYGENGGISNAWAVPPRVRDADIREQYVERIVAVGPAAVPSLIALLDDPRPGYPTAAVFVLGRIGRDAASANDALQRLLLTADRSLRPVIAATLAAINDPRDP